MTTMAENSPTEELPTDWNEWRKLWNAWRDSHRAEMTYTTRPQGFPSDKNILADEVLGWFTCPNGTVELSEVTMPAFGERPRRTVRFVGYTFAPHLEGETGVVSTFAELDEVLGFDHPEVPHYEATVVAEGPLTPGPKRRAKVAVAGSSGITTRNASPQAWRRLRSLMAEGELADIAADIAAVIVDEEATDLDAIFTAIEYALTGVPWDRKSQA